MSVIERETKAIEAVEEELQSLIPDGPYEEWHADQAGEIVSRVFEAIGYTGAVSLADVCEFLRSATYPDPASGGTRHVSGWQSAAVALEREFGGRT